MSKDKKSTTVAHYYNLHTPTLNRLLDYPVLTAGPLTDVNILPYLTATLGRLGGGFLYTNATEVKENRVFWDIPNPSDCKLRLGLHFYKGDVPPHDFQFVAIEDPAKQDLHFHFIRSMVDRNNTASCFSLEFEFEE
jgi:hypothetical protein